MIRCLIADDEEIARQIVEKYILQTPGLSLVGKCRNAMEAFGKLEQQAVDLIFLDIEMPLINGLTFLKTLTNPPKVIFTTAYPDFALQAFDLSVVDYLLKPFSYERFQRAVEKVIIQSYPTSSMQEEGQLLVKEKGGLIKVPYHSILYIQAARDYVKIVTMAKVHVAGFTMKSLEEQLPAEKFVRVHKSYIVSLEQVKMIRAEQVLLSENHELPLSPNYKENLLVRFGG